MALSSFSAAAAAAASKRILSHYCHKTSSAYTVRTFFASSTDHTQLLADAEVHKLQEADNVTQYVLAAQGTDTDTVQKVPQLHLARLYLKDNRTVYGAKVVNRTLGEPVAVCPKLLLAAQEDGARRAKSNLHGMNEFVLFALHQPVLLPILQQRTKADRQLIQQVAENDPKVTDQGYKAIQETWGHLAMYYTQQLRRLKEGEAPLYLAHNGLMTDILHKEDTSEYASTCAGAMAEFEFWLAEDFPDDEEEGEDKDKKD